MSARRSTGQPFADLAHGGLYSGAIGAAVLALVFLVRDALVGRALHTPSVLGGALFANTAPSTLEGVNLTWVALYTAVHVVAFQVLGWAAAAAYRSMRVAGRLGTAGIAFFLLLAIAGAYLGAAATIMPGIATEIGFLMLTVTSAITAGAMALTLRWSFRQSTIPNPGQPRTHREPAEGRAEAIHPTA